MAKQAGDMVHREKRNLWNLKHLLTKFRGDEIWIPCEALQSESDIALFGSATLYNGTAVSGSHQLPGDGNEPTPANSGDTIDVLEKPTDRGDIGQDDQSSGTTDGMQPTAVLAPKGGTRDEGVNSAITGETQQPDVEMVDAMNGRVAANKVTESSARILDRADPQTTTQAITTEGLHKQSLTTHPIVTDNVPTSSGGIDSELAANLIRPEHPPSSATPPLKDSETQFPAIGAGTNPEFNYREVGYHGDGQLELMNQDDDELQSAPHRMTTRARAQAVSDNTTSLHTRSPSPASSIPPYIHPLYLVPQSARPDRDFGLPPAEAEETRRVLMSYVQKQEEVCRGAERLYEGLLKADRMRKTILKWCKAEGHVGDASDGEDWYDKEEWGLEEDLKKGGEDDDDDTANQGKKTRGRRA